MKTFQQFTESSVEDRRRWMGAGPQKPFKSREERRKEMGVVDVNPPKKPEEKK
jgi:hypothetical protein